MKSHRAYIFLLAAIPALLMCVTASGRPLELQFATQNTESNLSSATTLRPWIEQVEKASKGKVQIKVHYGQSLAKGEDSWKAVMSGKADMAWAVLGYWPGLTPLSDVVTLPGLPFKTAEEGSEMFWKLYRDTPAMQEEFKDVKVLLLHTSDPYILLTRKKPVKSLEDLQGMKIRTFGSNLTMQVKKLGAVPVSIGMPENYTALQKRVIDGLAAPWEAANGFKFYQVVDYYTEVPFGALHFAVIMNRDAWNKLGKETQEALMSVSGLGGAKFWGRNFFDNSKAAAMENASKEGREIDVMALSAEERKRWIERSRPVWENWIEVNEKKGKTEAAELLQRALTIQ